MRGLKGYTGADAPERSQGVKSDSIPSQGGDAAPGCALTPLDFKAQDADNYVFRAWQTCCHIVIVQQSR